MSRAARREEAPNDDLLTLREAAVELGVSYGSIQRYVYQEHILRSVKIFGGRRIPVEAIEQYRAYRAKYPRYTRKRKIV